MTRADRQAQKLQAECDAFNASTPVGAEVVVKMDDGKSVITKTRAEAQVLSGHTAVVWLDNRAWAISTAEHVIEKRMEYLERTKRDVPFQLHSSLECLKLLRVDVVRLIDLARARERGAL